MLSFIIIFPIFAIAGLGFLLALTPLFDRSHIQGLSQFVFYVAIPALLFQSLSQVNLPEQINWQFVGSYYIVVIAIYAAGFLVNKLLFRGSRRSSAIFGMASSYSNMVLIGIPIVNATFGDDGLVPIVVLVSIHSALQFSTTTLIAESSMGDQKKECSIF
ncbi:MAG: AEC family transporter [Chloroflexota bacterium]